MTKAEHNLLGKAFAAEIQSAASDGKIAPIMQTKAKLADALCEKGWLEKVEVTLTGYHFPVIIRGYVLTHAGRYEYCRRCGEEDAE